jgi:hypothetical protein
MFSQVNRASLPTLVKLDHAVYSPTPPPDLSTHFGNLAKISGADAEP